MHSLHLGNIWYGPYVVETFADLFADLLLYMPLQTVLMFLSVDNVIMQFMFTKC